MLHLLLMLALSIPVYAQSWQPLLLSSLPRQTPAESAAAQSAAFDALRKEGFNAIYNLDYATARAKFEEMIKLDPKHPASHFYLATNQWLSILYSKRRLQFRLYNDDSFYARDEDKVDPQVDQQFRATIDKAILAAKVRLVKNEDDVEALYYLGAAYGMLASYEASVARRFLPALRRGSRGVDNHRKVIKLDPSYADAYLSIGLYDYILGTLPWSIKGILRLVGVKGDRKQGLKEIQTAVTKGKYANDDARIILIALYQREAKYGEALKLLEELAMKYPQNYLVSLERAAVLGRMGKSCESYAAFDQVLKDERARAVADLIHYQYGEVLFDGGEFTRATEQFVAVTKTPKADAALVSLAHLRQGQAFDAEGQHTSAFAQYQIVLKRENVFDSHNLARKYNNRPYAPEKTRQEKCVPSR